MAKHVTKPTLSYVKHGRTGLPPSSTKIAYPSVDALNHLRDWRKKGPLFTYSGNGPGSNMMDESKFPSIPNSSGYGEFVYYIILHSPPRTDTSKPYRWLGGVLLPYWWVGNSTIAPDTNTHTEPARVIWNQFQGDQQILWEATGRFPGTLNLLDGISMVPHEQDSWQHISVDNAIQLFKRGTNRFRWLPKSDGGFTFGCLETRGIGTAALTVWDSPENENNLSDAQACVTRDNLQPGQFIRGWSSSASHPPSYGDVEHYVGDLETSGSNVIDSAYNASMRCMFQTGHWGGIYCSGTDYKNIRTAPGENYGSYFRVSAPNPLEDSSTIETYPAIIANVADSTYPGYVKFTSSNAADSWYVEVTSETPMLYTAADGSQASLTCNLDYDGVDNFEDIKIEAYCDTGEYVNIRTVSLWCAGY